MMCRIFVINLIFIFSIIGKTSGIIYHLNDTEYEQLPVLFELENYDSCMQDTAAIYCVASLELYGETESKIYNLIQEYSQHRNKHFNYSVIDRGVCVTKSCVRYTKNGTLNIDKDLNIVLGKCLNDRIKEKYNLSTRINRLNCDRHTEADEKDILDYIVATVVIFLCTAVVVGSWYDMRYNVKKGQVKIGKGGRVLLSFSIGRNIEILTHEGDKCFDDLKGLHGVRSIGQIIVVFGHAYLFMSQFISDAHKFEKVYESLFYRLLLSLSSIVQIFFIMSGFLMTYLLEIYAENHHVTWKNIPNIIFQRWWRLTPSIAFVLAFTVTWFRYLGSGPLWKYFVTNGSSAQCRRYFWAHLLLLNNLFKKDTCSYQSWHIAADMQLFIFCLLVHFAICNRSLKFKICTLSFLLFIGIAGPIGHVWLQDLNGSFILTPEVYRTIQDDTFQKYHILPHNNIVGFVIGMAVGYLVYYLKQKKVESPNFMIGNILCWLALPMYLVVVYNASLFFEVEKPSLLLRILYASVHRVVIGLIGSIWILGIILKFNTCSKTLMEWNLWMVPSKLSYGVYLVHTEVIFYLLGSRTELLTHSLQNYFFVYLGILVVSNVLALVLYLLVEAPSKQLIKLFIGETSSKNEKKKY